MEDYSAGRRAAAYWFIDGLPDLVFGLAITLMSTSGLIYRLFLPTAWGAVLFGVFAVAFLVLFLWDRKIVDYLKSYITYPRTGYVEPPEEAEPATRNPPITLFPVAASPKKENVTWFRTRTVLFLLYVTMNIRLDGRWGAATIVPLVAAGLYCLNYKRERPFSLPSVVVLALLGVAISIADVPAAGRGFWPSLCAGVWLASLGLAKLIHYLRANPLPPAVPGVRV
jgi:hypothetical protein